MKAVKAVVATTKHAVVYDSKKKPIVSLYDLDDNESEINSMVCVQEEVKMAQGMSGVLYLGSGCNKITYREEAHEEPWAG